MICQWSLEPRVVEVMWAEVNGGVFDLPNPAVVKHDYLGPLPSHKDVVFFSLAKLPTALKVNQDSRNAVLPMYPLCFRSTSYDPYVRFNYSLDTLYVDEGLGRFAPFLLTGEMLGGAPKLQNVAVSEFLYYSKPSQYWKTMWAFLIDRISNIDSLKHVEVVVDVASILMDPQLPHDPDSAIVRQQISDEFWPDYQNKGVKLSEDYSQELADRLGLTDEQTALYLYTEHENVWVEKNAKLVWGFRKLDYAELKGDNRNLIGLEASR